MGVKDSNGAYCAGSRPSARLVNDVQRGTSSAALASRGADDDLAGTWSRWVPCLILFTLVAADSWWSAVADHSSCGLSIRHGPPDPCSFVRVS